MNKAGLRTHTHKSLHKHTRNSARVARVPSRNNMLAVRIIMCVRVVRKGKIGTHQPRGRPHDGADDGV